MIGVRVDFANQSARLSTNCWEFWEAIASLPSKLSSFINFKPIVGAVYDRAISSIP
jgi:hypothetical protein